MLASSASLTADDVCVRCTVRRSSVASNPVFDEEQEMTCTMRNWKTSHDGNEDHLGQRQAGNDTGDGSLNGPELLLCPVHLPVRATSPLLSRAGDNEKSELPTERFHSFGSIPSLSVPQSIHCDPNNVRTLNRSPSPAASRSRNNSDGSHSSGTGGRSPYDRCQSSRKRGLLPPSMRASAAGMFATLDSGLHTNAIDMAASVQNLACLKSYAIPLGDIVVVDVDGANSRDFDDKTHSMQGGNRMGVTTMSNGYFEFSFISKNSHDVLMAFLQSSLPPEKMTMGSTYGNVPGREIINSDSGNSSSFTPILEKKSSVDMDKLTEKEIKDSVNAESLPQRIRRKMTTVVERFGEVSVGLSECMCGDFTREETPKAVTTPTTSKKDFSFRNRSISPLELSFERASFRAVSSDNQPTPMYEPETVAPTLEADV
mmetsp:Transcript_29973/g.43791  ORF Transcript_29973/g.43791 Transcript_29973/m.43791 type:complete len:428 (+) Transcript_29973:147-1430(+)